MFGDFENWALTRTRSWDPWCTSSHENGGSDGRWWTLVDSDLRLGDLWFSCATPAVFVPLSFTTCYRQWCRCSEWHDSALEILWYHAHDMISSRIFRSISWSSEFSLQLYNIRPLESMLWDPWDAHDVFVNLTFDLTYPITSIVGIALELFDIINNWYPVPVRSFQVYGCLVMCM